MFGNKVLRIALATTILAAGFVAAPAFAQSGPAPVRQSIDANGVDLFLGTINYDGPTLSAGQGGQTGLSFRKLGRSGGGGDSIWAQLFVTGSTIYASFGGTTDSFTVSGSSYIPTEANGASLALSGNIYTYTARDGSVAHFDKLKTGAYPNQTAVAMVTDITQPDGSSLTYTYDSLYYCSSYKQLSNGPTCLQHSYAYRNGSVTSKGGYKATLQYNAIDPVDEMNGEFPDFTIWGNPVGVAMTNTAITGASTRTQTFVYSSAGGGTTNLKITDPMYRETTFRFAPTGFGIKLPGSSSEDVTVTYSSGKVATVTNPVGTWTYAYSDLSGVRTVTVTNPASKTTTYTFDIASARMKSMTDATGRATRWDYDSNGRLTRTTAQEGNYVQTTYDSRGNVTETRAVDKSGISSGSDLVSTASYDPTCTNPATCNQPNTITDARGKITEYAYNTDGTVSTVTAPAPTSGATRPKATYTYTTVNGVSVLDTSSVCRTTASCAGTADETKTVIAYNANGLPSAQTTKAGDNSLSATTAIGYDDVGNVTSVDGPMSGSDDAVTYRYDADRERVGTIGPDPDGMSGALVRAATRNTYDARGRVYVAAVGTVASLSDSDWAAFIEAYHLYSQYDARGLVIRQTIWSAGVDYAVSDYLYDLVGRRTCAIQYMDPAQWGPQASSCAPLQNNGPMGPDRAVKTSYDDAGRVTKVQSAYGITGVQSDDVTTAYTANGQVQSVTDAENNKTTYEYDGFDRLKKTFYPSTTKGAGTSNLGPPGDYEELTYDAGSNVTNRRLRDNSNIGYTYDALNRMITKDLPGSELDVSYGYNLLSQPLTAATSAQTVTLAYDALGRATSQTTGTGTVGYQYDLAGRRTRMTWPDTFYVTYDYDTAGNLKAIKESGSTTLAAFDYDSLGRRTLQTRGNGVTTSYSFDNASRLTQMVMNPTGTSYDQTIDLGYNPAGQIKSRTASNDAYAWTGAMNVNRAYTANGLNQFSASGGTTLTYDARGNLNASGSDSYTYSAENLLTSATVGSVTTALTYDPLGRLFQIGTSGGMKLVYDGTAIIGQSTGSSVGKRYVTVPGSDEVLVEYKVSNGTRDYKLLDERGSVIAGTDASGTASGINAYDEYGLPNSGGNSMRFQYTGQFYLSEVGLYYYKARMYSPYLGRFMQTDPIGYGDGMNWYNYVGGDPVNKFDPFGLTACNFDSRHPEDVVVCGSRGRTPIPAYWAPMPSENQDPEEGFGDGGGLGEPPGDPPLRDPRCSRVVKLPKMMTEATNNALSAINQNPGGNSARELNAAFSSLNALPDFSSGGWISRPSSHSSEAYEHPLPGSSGMVVKVYINDRENLGLNTITITPPTYSLLHLGEFPFYQGGAPVNTYNAAKYLADRYDCE